MRGVTQFWGRRRRDGRSRQWVIIDNGGLSLSRFSAATGRHGGCGLATLPKGLGDVRRSPLGVTHFLLVLVTFTERKAMQHRSVHFAEKGRTGISENAHRLPGPTVLENVEHLEERGSSKEFLGRLPRGRTASVFIVRGSKHPQGEIFYICRGRALDGDGVR
jgi:hypothetical protein